MTIIIPEEELKQLEQIGYVSVDQLKTMLEGVDASDADVEALHEELEERGVIITETAPPDLPRNPQNEEADPQVPKGEEELNA